MAALLLAVSPVALAADDEHGHRDGHMDGHSEQGTPVVAEATIKPGEIYQQYCSVCHGDKGDGKSRAQGGLVPPPKDFTQPRVAIELTRERMIASVRDGRPGTAMSGWEGRLSRAEISAVVDYVRETFMPAVTTDDTLDGRRIFAEYCSVCHGDRGQGAVWAQSGLKPPPANFTDPETQAKLSRERMISSVTYGRAQTAMSAWGKRLNEEEIEAVVDYVRRSLMGIHEESVVKADPHGGGHDHSAHGVEEINNPLPGGLQGDYGRGEKLYTDNCVACHGETGDGQGPRAYFIFPKPRDFGHPEAQAKYSREHLYIVISKGELGTEMPAWDKVLTAQQIGDIAEYVFRTFIRPEPKG